MNDIFKALKKDWEVKQKVMASRETLLDFLQNLWQDRELTPEYYFCRGLVNDLRYRCDVVRTPELKAYLRGYADSVEWTYGVVYEGVKCVLRPYNMVANLIPLPIKFQALRPAFGSHGVVFHADTKYKLKDINDEVLQGHGELGTTKPVCWLGDMPYELEIIVRSDILKLLEMGINELLDSEHVTLGDDSVNGIKIKWAGGGTMENEKYYNPLTYEAAFVTLAKKLQGLRVNTDPGRDLIIVLYFAASGKVSTSLRTTLFTL